MHRLEILTQRRLSTLITHHVFRPATPNKWYKPNYKQPPENRMPLNCIWEEIRKKKQRRGSQVDDTPLSQTACPRDWVAIRKIGSTPGFQRDQLLFRHVPMTPSSRTWFGSRGQPLGSCTGKHLESRLD